MHNINANWKIRLTEQAVGSKLGYEKLGLIAIDCAGGRPATRAWCEQASNRLDRYDFDIGIDAMALNGFTKSHSSLQRHLTIHSTDPQFIIDSGIKAWMLIGGGHLGCLLFSHSLSVYAMRTLRNLGHVHHTIISRWGTCNRDGYLPDDRWQEDVLRDGSFYPIERELEDECLLLDL